VVDYVSVKEIGIWQFYDKSHACSKYSMCLSFYRICDNNFPLTIQFLSFQKYMSD
jgi:hypothetical protein